MPATPLVLATDYSGTDIGAKIMAADADLGAINGIIVVPAGNYTISTQIILGQGGGGRKLILGDGTYDNTMTDRSPILLKDNCEIVAARRWGAKVYETINRVADVTNAIIDYQSSIDNTQPGNSNIAVRGLAFLKKATTADGVSATVEFGNCTDVVVEDCHFEDTSGFCISAGGSPALGNFARNIRVLNNTMQRAGTQNIAFVNVVSGIIDGNIMTAGGAGGRDKSTFIDVELNQDTDHGEDLIVVNNVIDARGGTPAGPGTGIKISGAKAGDPKNSIGVICAHNVILGGALDQATNPVLAGGILVALIDDALVHDNYIRYCGQVSITVLAGDNCSVVNNRLDDGGPVGTIPQTITLTGARWCTVAGNQMATRLGGNNYVGVWETSDVVYGQTSDFNEIHDNRLYFAPSQTPTLEVHEPRITLTGANSREWNNSFSGDVFGVAGVSTVASLTSGYVPGDRAAGVPALASVLGVAAYGDCSPLQYVYDTTSTKTVNGLTTLKPANASTGRWQMAPMFPKMDTTTRDALTLGAADATLTIFNTTVGKLQCWDGAAWNNLF